MATASTFESPKSDANENSNSIPKSRFLKTVSLLDWWLLKPENDSQGGGLSVSGCSTREQGAMRVFSSAPILKAHDVRTLETTDGVFVLLKGFINKDHTLKNGFPSHVFNHFVIGFPTYWKEYAEESMGWDTYVGSNEMGDESRHKMDVNRCKPRSSAVLLPPKYDGVAFGGHDIISPDSGIRSACHLNNNNRATKGRATPGSSSKLKRKHENNQITDRISGGYNRTRSKSVLPSGGEKVKLDSINFESRDKNNLYCGDIGFKEPMEMSKTPKRSQNWHGAADKEKEHALANESSISEKDGMSKMKTRRKCAYGTPGRDKEEVLSGSSKSLSFSRSRSALTVIIIQTISGREKALYDAEGSATGIEDEIVMKGKNGRPQRMKRQLSIEGHRVIGFNDAN